MVNLKKWSHALQQILQAGEVLEPERQLRLVEAISTVAAALVAIVEKEEGGGGS